MKVSPSEIKPSQDFLKPGTLRYIIQCLEEGRAEDLPPNPIVVKSRNGELVALDGHNKIAVWLLKGMTAIDVVLAETADPIFADDSSANRSRNAELAAKFDNVLSQRDSTIGQGVETFTDLLERYSDTV